MRLAAAKVALAPLLLTQGMYVRRVTPKLPEPQGARVGVTGTGKPLRLLIVGDSAAAGVGAAHQNDALLGQLVAALATEFEVSWCLIAQTGLTTLALIKQLEQQPSQLFDIAVTSLGVNDVTSQVKPQIWLQQQQQLIELLLLKFGVQKILLSSVPPMHHFSALPHPLRWYLGQRAHSLNTLLEQATQRRENCVYVATQFEANSSLLAADGFHPSSQAYTIWAKQLAQAINPFILTLAN
jgi:lysophospholipase L1-like esterase